VGHHEARKYQLLEEKIHTREGSIQRKLHDSERRKRMQRGKCERQRRRSSWQQEKRQDGKRRQDFKKIRSSPPMVRMQNLL
jgi:hypothetical protein